MTENQFENAILSLLKSIDKSLGRIADALDLSRSQQENRISHADMEKIVERMRERRSK